MFASALFYGVPLVCLRSCSDHQSVGMLHLSLLFGRFSLPILPVPGLRGPLWVPTWSPTTKVTKFQCAGSSIFNPKDRDPLPYSMRAKQSTEIFCSNQNKKDPTSLTTPLRMKLTQVNLSSRRTPAMNKSGEVHGQRL